MTLVEGGASASGFSVGLAHVNATLGVSVIIVARKMINPRPTIDPNNRIRRAMSASVRFEHVASSNERRMEREEETKCKANRREH